MNWIFVNLKNPGKMCGFFATNYPGFCRVYAGLICSGFSVGIVDSNSLAFFMVKGMDNTDISERNTTELRRYTIQRVFDIGSPNCEHTLYYELDNCQS